MGDKTAGGLEAIKNYTTPRQFILFIDKTISLEAIKNYTTPRRF